MEVDSSCDLVCTSLKWGIKQGGTMAFGSLLHAIVMVIKWILNIMKHYAKKTSNNPFVKCLVGCLACLVGCCECILKYINKNAYIQSALFGTGYIVSTYKAVELIGNHLVKFVIIDGLGDIIERIGVFFIAGVGTFLSFLLITE
mmetsp:Transcript_19940/g.9280  ORF Transcript_19940/g.9280 Transcript_19940/m.9280 type:complete len:144 (-) Transcript_19940:60-491(-)